MVKTSVDDLFGDAVQLASTGSAIFTRIPLQDALISRVTREVYASALNPHIYGTGPFFAPGVVDGGLTSFYVRRVDPGVGRSVQDHPFRGGVEVDYRSPAPIARDDYTRQVWFERAVQAGGRTIVWGPYRDQARTFISIERAFYRDGKMAGVFSVDILERDFLGIVRKDLVRGDVAAVVTHGGRVLLATGAIPADRMHMFTSLATMRFAPHTEIELLSDGSVLHAGYRTIWFGTGGLLVVIWLIAALIGIGLVQRWRAHEARLLLEVDQRRLEHEIELSHAVEIELRNVAYTDALTGLPNRRAFLEYAGTIVGTDRSHIVLFIDLDRFNLVNETLGHLAGDEFLRVIGARLQQFISKDDVIARLGGDEFVLAGPLSGRPPIDVMCSRLFAEMGQPIVVNGRSFYPEASIGIVAVDGSYTGADEILRDADIAMYEAKRRGRARYVIFDAEMRRRVAGDSELEAALRRALERKELMPYYQPVVRVESGEIAGFEALARWNRAGTIVTASEFMPFAEQHGLSAAIDAHVLQEVYQHSRAIYNLFPGTKIAVNVSAPELASPALHDMVEMLRERNGRAGDGMVFEITETAMMTNPELAVRTIERLRELEIEFVLDDFGTGYSSLAYLQHLPISGIKIDRSFVAPIAVDLKASEIVRSIVMLARSFGLTTTAEGVETLSQWEIVRDLGVDFAQGFFFSPAIDMASLTRLKGQSQGRFAVE